MPKASIAAERSIVLTGRSTGLSIIPQPTPLTRLRFFDGKFLRAADFELEQRYHRELVAQSNRAGGSGVVHGFDCTRAGDALTIGEGLAIDPQGRVLLLPEERDLSLDELIRASRARSPIPTARPASARDRRIASFEDCIEAIADDGDAVAEGAGLYLIVAFHAEALCGEEDVYGKLCEEACVTSTERPYIVEGVVIRAVPLDLTVPLVVSKAVTLTRKHLRSRVASAYFEQERRAVASLISRAGLRSEAWCHGAPAAAGSGVPLALVARAGTDTLFLDAWTARRERIEPPPRRYWAQVMAMRPWDVFLAQVLQFQCQLRSALVAAGDPGQADDPCADAYRMLADASEKIERVLVGIAEEGAAEGAAEVVDERAILERNDLRGGEVRLAEISGIRYENLDAIRSRLAVAAEGFFTPATERLLIEGGIVELPPAGYLPVLPDLPVGVERQVRQLVGDGLDLRFCVVRPDFVPHALEEAQHMERISLTAGLGRSKAKPRVDVLVPDGVFEERATVSPGTGYDTTVRIEEAALGLFALLFGGGSSRFSMRGISSFSNMVDFVDQLERETPPDVAVVSGAARGETLPGGGSAFHFAGGSRQRKAADDIRAEEAAPGDEQRIFVNFETVVIETPKGALWVTLRVDRDPFSLAVHGSAEVSAEVVLLLPMTKPRTVLRLRFAGTLSIDDRRSLPGGGTKLAARLTGTGTLTSTPVDAPRSAIVSIPVSESLQLESEPGERRKVRILVPGPRLSDRVRTLIEIERSWPVADRAEVASELRIASEKDTRHPIFGADERVDAAVLAPGHAAHDSSLAALEAIGAALGDARFADDAARKLFPPPEIDTRQGEIRATRDWVLFHRRRDKDCGEGVAPAPSVQPRRYRVFHVGLRSAEEVKTFERLLAGGGSLLRFTQDLVDTVDFGAGIQAVETPHDEVRTAWSAKVPARAEIVYGAIASQGTALDEGDALARARLGALAGVLAPLAPRADDAELDVLPTVPPALSVGDRDGVIVLATVRVTVDLNEVYRTELTEEAVAVLLRELSNEDLPIENVFKQFQVETLGQTGFRAGTAELFGQGMADVPEQWRLAGDGAVAEALVIAPPEAESAAGQATRIAIGVGGTAHGEKLRLRRVDPLGRSLGDASALTVLVVRPAVELRCHEVVVFPVSSAVALDRIRNEIAESGISEDAFGEGRPRLGEVRFQADSAEPVAETLEEMKVEWDRLLEGGELPRGSSLRGLVVSPAGSSESVQDLHRAQAAALLRVLGGGIEVDGVIQGSDTFPVDCEALTLAVVVLRSVIRHVQPPVVFVPEDGEPQVKLTPRFDDAGELIRDEAFERDTETMLAEGTRFVRLAFAAPERPDMSDRRLMSLFDALKEKGLLTDDARRSTRGLQPELRRRVEARLDRSVPSVMILEVE